MSPRALPPGVSSYRDRHGRLRWRYRRGGVTVQLGADFGSDAFRERLDAAVRRTAPEPQRAAPGKGSVSALIAAYRLSPRYVRTKGRWRQIMDAHLSAMDEMDGPLPVAAMRVQDVEQRLAWMHETPIAANRRLSMWRRVLDYGQRLGWLTGNPAKLVEPYPAKTAGFHTWTDEEIARYLAHHTGDARIAMGLMLYTGAARADAVLFSRRNVVGNRFRYRRGKTGAEIDIPLHPDLAALIAEVPAGRFTFLETAQGKARTANGLGNAMRGWCDAAGLPACTSHGLRKARARLLAEAGATEHEIASVTGHDTLAEVERYTRRANRSKMADAAFGKVLRLANRGKGDG